MPSVPTPGLSPAMHGRTQRCRAAGRGYEKVALSALKTRVFAEGLNDRITVLTPVSPFHPGGPESKYSGEKLAYETSMTEFFPSKT